MDRENITRAMPSIRQDFESLKESLREGRMHAACSTLFGACVAWGDKLRKIYADDGRDALNGRDFLTRFFVLRYRGMPEPAEIDDAPGAARFLMAFTAFSYVDALMDETVIGEHMGCDEDGNWLVGRVLAGDPDGTWIRVDPAGARNRFDLMSLYRNKADAIESYVADQFQGDFDAFMLRYVGDHDLAFDMDRAWRPMSDKGGI